MPGEHVPTRSKHIEPGPTLQLAGFDDLSIRCGGADRLIADGLDVMITEAQGAKIAAIDKAARKLLGRLSASLPRVRAACPLVAVPITWQPDAS